MSWNPADVDYDFHVNQIKKIRKLKRRVKKVGDKFWRENVDILKMSECMIGAYRQEANRYIRWYRRESQNHAKAREEIAKLKAEIAKLKSK